MAIRVHDLDLEDSDGELWSKALSGYGRTVRRLIKAFNEQGEKRITAPGWKLLKTAVSALNYRRSPAHASLAEYALTIISD